MCLALLAACNRSTPVTQVPTDTPVATDTPVPADTPEPSPTPTNTPTPEPPSVDVSPSTDVELKPGETLPLQAVASGAGKITYEWQLTGVGTLSAETDKPAIVTNVDKPVETFFALLI